MECKGCKKQISYNRHYQCYECKCGKVYNALGQELAPVSDWKDEYDSGDDYY